MSQRDRDRLVFCTRYSRGQLSPGKGARRARLGARHFRRLMRRFERVGDVVVVHRLRGWRSNRRLPEEVREAALAKARQSLYSDFGPTLLLPSGSGQIAEVARALGPIGSKQSTHADRLLLSALLLSVQAASKAKPPSA